MTTVAADDTLSPTELILLSLEHRFGRMSTALEMAAKGTVSGANNIDALTAQIGRLADAFEAMAGFIGCVTESVKGEDGEYRCFVRTHDRSNHAYLLSDRDDRDTDED